MTLCDISDSSPTIPGANFKTIVAISCAKDKDNTDSVGNENGVRVRGMVIVR